MRYIVFSGAPRRGELVETSGQDHLTWKTTTNRFELDAPVSANSSGALSFAVLLSQPMLDAALSRLSEHVLDVSGDSISVQPVDEESAEDTSGRDTSADDTAITWELTDPRAQASPPLLPRDLTLSRDETQLTPDDSQTDAGERTSFLTASRDDSYRHEESIAIFPSFAFNPARVTTLAALPARASSQGAHNVLAGVLEATGPETINTKTGPVALLQLVLGDGSGPVVRLAVWRELAEEWTLRRGDVVHISNVAVAAQGGGLSASARQRSAMQICYRALPTVPADARFRPDLRLAKTDAAIGQVAAVVRWVEHMAGLG